MKTYLDLFGIRYHLWNNWYFYQAPRYGDMKMWSAECPSRNLRINRYDLKSLFGNVRLMEKHFSDGLVKNVVK